MAILVSFSHLRPVAGMAFNFEHALPVAGASVKDFI
jgi:hypothetical protein